MKNKHINLFTQDFNNELLFTLLKKIKTIALPLLILSVIFIAAEVLGLWYVATKTKGSETTLQTLTGFIQSNSNFDRKIKYFIFKKNLVNAYLKEDAQGYIYYDKFKNILATLAPFVTLTEFDFDNTRAASVSVTFLKYEDLLNFLNIIETKEFLTNFTFVSISEFDPYQGNIDENEIQLNMQVQFISEDGKKT